MLRQTSLLLVFLLMLFTFPARAQKQLKEVRTALKNEKYSDALTKVAELRKDSTWTDSPRLCLYAIEANRGLNDAENVKLYLKQAYDTLSFFSTTKEIITECLRLDSIERSNTLVKGKRENRDFINENLRKYYPNIAVASRWLIKKKQYTDAMVYLRMCLDLPNTPCGEDAELSNLTSKGKDIKSASLYATSAYLTKKYSEVPRYKDLALQDSSIRSALIERFALSAEELGDSATYIEWIRLGWEEFPMRPPFFLRYADHYGKRGDYEKILELSKRQIEIDSTSRAALLAQSNAYYNLKMYEEMVESGLALLSVDSTNVEANYYVGAGYAALAGSITMPDNIHSKAYAQAKERRLAFCEKAEKYLEKYREFAPEQKERWAPILYKIYFELNRESKFEEIEKLL